MKKPTAPDQPSHAKPSAAARAPARRKRPAAPSVPVGTLDPALEARLLAAALAARGQAYAPYSHFAVGAALLDDQGRIHAGCNVENAAYPLGTCAEGGALSALVLAGGRRIRAVAVAAQAPQPVTPCGGCRQKLREFAAGDTPVLSADASGLRARYTLSELLPASFGPEHLSTS